jgi:formylglycine-generating enzyme required for sulfatase activity
VLLGGPRVHNLVDTNLTSGEVFRDVIDRELDAADAVIVIWTPQSITSKWAIAEAEHADGDGKLIPLRTSDVDTRRIPKPYNTYHTAMVDDRAAILAAVQRLISQSLASKSGEADEPSRMRAEGRILVDATIVHNASGNWFKPGAGKTEWFKDIDIGPEMMVVPAGEFLMGSEDGDDSGSPTHRVTIAKAFAVGRFAVTFDEWDACVADGGCMGHRPDDEGWGRDKRPVINVSWDHAKLNIAWLSAKTGKNYRLLSEAERAHAARAGTMAPYWWSWMISTNQANYDGKNASGRGPSDSPPSVKLLYPGHVPAGSAGVHSHRPLIPTILRSCCADIPRRSEAKPR